MSGGSPVALEEIKPQEPEKPVIKIRVVICGDRVWDDVDAIYERIYNLYMDYGDDLIIVSGGARGADSIAEAAAKGLGIETHIIDAPWDKINPDTGRPFGLSAGPRRNDWMLDTNPILVVAFHPDLSRSKGTIDTIKKSIRRKIPIEVYPENEYNRRTLEKLGVGREKQKAKMQGNNTL